MSKYDYNHKNKTHETLQIHGLSLIFNKMQNFEKN